MSVPRLPPRSAAADAIAAGRPALTRSFRFHRARGAPCGLGWCGLCEIQTPAGRELACLADAPAPSAKRDWLRPFGLAAERMRPWFYERRFLRPATLRRTYLHTLRYLSSAPALGREPIAAVMRRYVEEELETAIVGEVANFDGVPIGVYGERTLAVLTENKLVAIRFERLVIATRAYDRLPPVRGNDLPGVIGLGALEAYAAQGGLRAGLRIGAWGPEERLDRVRAVADAHGLAVVHAMTAAPRAIEGRTHVAAIDVGERIPCDLFVFAVAQPAIELALQAGASGELSADGTPIVAATNVPSWVELRGDAAARASGVPDVPADEAAFACMCEDVRVGDVRAAISAGFDHPELVKRRTGALTGPCQGKLCAPVVLALLREAGMPHEPTISRPPSVGLQLADLAADA